MFTQVKACLPSPPSDGPHLLLMHLQFLLNEAADLVEGRSLGGLQAPACLHDVVPAGPNGDRAVTLCCCKAAGGSAGSSLQPLASQAHSTEQFLLFLSMKPVVSARAVLQGRVSTERDRTNFSNLSPRAFMPPVRFSLSLNSFPSRNLLGLVFSQS